MKKVYVSSPYKDLMEHREQVIRQLRAMDFLDVAMEHYTASDERPLDKCLADIHGCDMYLGIFAWRYGHIPAGQHQSITELEYREAGKCGKPIRIFLLQQDSPFSPQYIDAITGDGDQGEKIRNLREELQQAHTIAEFTTPKDLANKVSAAIHRWHTEELQKQQEEADQISHQPRHDLALHRYLDSRISHGEVTAEHYVELRGRTKKERAIPPNRRTNQLIPPSLRRVVSERLDTAGTEEVEFESVSEVLQVHPSCVIVGEPGSGKSTTLEHMELSAAQQALQDMQARCPLLIRLSEWPDSITDLASLIVHESHIKGMPPTPLNRLLLLCDGLNEIDAASYPKKLQAVEKWTNDHPESRVILTSRKRDYCGRRQLRLPIVEIRPLNANRIEQFVSNYCGQDDGQVLLEQMGWLQNQSEEYSQLIELARNPYQLVAICYIFQNDRKVPRNRGQLFQILVEILYAREADRGNTIGIDLELMLEAFGRIALEMYQSRSSTSVPLDWAKKRLPDGRDPEVFWNLGLDASLIYLTKNNRFLKFSHQMLQEYFAAQHLLDYQKLPARGLLTPKFSQGRRTVKPFDEVICMLAGLPGSEVVFRKLAASDPHLAIDALMDAGDGGKPIRLHAIILTFRTCRGAIFLISTRPSAPAFEEMYQKLSVPAALCARKIIQCNTYVIRH